MIKKQHYETPETEVLEVRFEENIMSLPNRGKGGIGNFSEDSGDNVSDDSDGWI